jgi:hypothetical protein
MGELGIHLARVAIGLSCALFIQRRKLGREHSIAIDVIQLAALSFILEPPITKLIGLGNTDHIPAFVQLSFLFVHYMDPSIKGYLLKSDHSPLFCIIVQPINAALVSWIHSLYGINENYLKIHILCEGIKFFIILYHHLVVSKKRELHRKYVHATTRLPLAISDSLCLLFSGVLIPEKPSEAVVLVLLFFISISKVLKYRRLRSNLAVLNTNNVSMARLRQPKDWND